MYSNIAFTFTSSKSSATQFFIDPAKLLTSSSGVGFSAVNEGINLNYLWSLPYSSAATLNPLRCSIDSGTLAVNCVGDGTGYNTWAEIADSNNGGRAGVAIGTYQAASSGSFGLKLIGLKAVPVS
ncbi:hypothetical protein H072_285 [Dactylellina haptotyla CBS 200.50]|uniref:Uncharacterized protein n=1 Tax=Dactylellina haptotyla (strain CBS 200.50) TaxID=1284197 RepID=S8CDK8_DACHA|nr:hypothetical protein H072_285 [Dactylellina haptotyla CBS 200.50]